MAEIDDLLDGLDDAIETQIEPVERGIMSVSNEADTPVIDVREHVQRAGAISDEILISWRSDRCEAQGAANFIKDIIDPIIASGERPPAALIEQYVRALEVKASTNQTAVKCLDGISKLLAATKQGVQINNNTLITGNNHDLISALKRPVHPDEP